MSTLPSSSKLVLLGSLYLAQGLPYGFFTQALPVLLRKEGVSLTLIGASSLLALPWALKFLWAPLVDGVKAPKVGRRRAVILPLQALSALLMLALAFVSPQHSMMALVVGVLVANAIAATQDIATDGLAISTLTASERGFGNGLQVAGYRVGMILGGGALLIVFDALGWKATFLAMSALLVVSSLPVWRHRETPGPMLGTDPHLHDSSPGILAGLINTLRIRGMPAWMLVLVLYKGADALASAMLRPFLVDLGLTMSDIGWLLGGIGFAGGLIGALLGGALVVPLGRRRALIGFGILQCLAVALYLVPATVGLSMPIVIAAVGLEHLAGGMATAALFTLMMDRTDERSGGTDYTVQASVVVIATGAAAAFSGALAEAVGYAGLFGLSAAAGLVAIAVIAAGLLGASHFSHHHEREEVTS